jgi:hypothetical protein
MKEPWRTLFTGEAARRRWLWLVVLAAVLIVLALTGNLRQG